MDRVISRRTLLTTTAMGCAGVGLGLAAAPAAGAFSIEEGSAQISAQYSAARAACTRGGDTLHRQLLADVRAKLDAEHVPVQRQQQLLSGMTCPLCGCSLG